MKPQSIEGRWWLPETPDRRSFGTLEYDGSGYPRLSLVDSITDATDEIAGRTVLGLSARAAEITVEVDFETGRSTVNTSKGHSLEGQKLAVRQAFVGAHHPDEDDRRFTNVAVEYSDLVVWTGWRGPADHLGAGEIEIQYKVPDDLCADLDWGRICVRPGWGTEDAGPSSRTMRVTAGFHVTRPDPVPARVWLADVVGPLKDLLTIATDRANQVEAVRFWADDFRDSVELIYASTSVELPAPVSHPLDFLFTALDIETDLSNRLQRWFTLRAEMAPALDLYLATQYRKSMHLENRFLSTAGALEAYHRRRYPVAPDVRDRHQERLERILKGVADGKDRDWLKWKLKYAYEPSLGDRIGELLARTSGVLGMWLGDPGSFATAVSSTRNDLIHRDPDAKTPSADGRTLLDRTEDLALVFLVCLLQDLGFDDAGVRRMLERTDRWRFLRFRKNGWSN